MHQIQSEIEHLQAHVGATNPSYDVLHLTQSQLRR